MRYKLQRLSYLSLIGIVFCFLSCTETKEGTTDQLDKERLNFLFVISDDQSWLDAGAYGNDVVQTPVFDSLANAGLLFNQAFCASPHCSVSRATLLTGLNQWQLQEAGTHSSGFPSEFEVFPDMLEENGYEIGFTGKGWGPGNWKDFGRNRDPAGVAYNKYKHNGLPARNLHNVDAAANFQDFLDQKEGGKPFWFWYGSKEPHVKYEYGVGLKHGIDTSAIELPSFVPDNPASRMMAADYYFEIQWFDEQLSKLIDVLTSNNAIENTVIIVTSDNGVIWPRAKRSLYEMGSRMPFVVSGKPITARRGKTDRLTSFVDIAPTVLELAGIPRPSYFVGKSFASLLDRNFEPAESPDFVLTGIERHGHTRPDNVGYPIRAIRTHKYLFIKNYRPERWPEGDPEIMGYGTSSLDSTSSWNQNYSQYTPGTIEFDLAFGKRPALELYAIETDTFCMRNLAEHQENHRLVDSLHQLLKTSLVAQNDPREMGSGDIFESYPRFGSMRQDLPGFKTSGAYNPDFQLK